MLRNPSQDHRRWPEAVETFQVLNDTLPKATGTAERLRRRNAAPNP
jgi:hypothetical protein